MTEANANTVNEPILPAPGEEWPDDGSMPAQMGGTRTLIMPGQHTLRLPSVLAQLWHDVAIKDTRPYLKDGQPNPNLGKQIAHRQIKFDQNAPLVIEGGKLDGTPMRATFTTNPRARGKKDDPKTAWVSDVAYITAVCLADTSRPKNHAEQEAIINRAAGKTIRLETGLTAQCRPDKVRYIEVTTMDGGVATTSTMQDPQGIKGCGKRHYTPAFLNPTSGKYDEEILCTCGVPKPDQAALGQQPVNVVLRAFEQVETFLAPLMAQPTAGAAQG